MEIKQGYCKCFPSSFLALQLCELVISKTSLAAASMSLNLKCKFNKLSLN
ncbi:hypothetical protein Fmac_023690 [Flemingia macrophylla]|uniref:Uncharacterized protein n=1 Tax=Flemingia macrophylla TaxID=520843 RepID=A0ABD1LMA2_9FABA